MEVTCKSNDNWYKHIKVGTPYKVLDKYPDQHGYILYEIENKKGRIYAYPKKLFKYGVRRKIKFSQI